MSAMRRLTSPEEHKQFIIDNWYHLAAYAWRGFQDHGRGFVTIFVERVQGEPNDERFPTFCAYASQNWLQKNGVPYPTPQLEDLVNHYDPEKSIVLLFTWKADGHEHLHPYRAAAKPDGGRDYPKDTVWLGNVGQLRVRDH